MRNQRLFVWILVALFLVVGSLSAGDSPSWLPQAASGLEASLIEQYGEGQRDRIQQGLRQVGDFWRAEDGDQAAFEDFVQTNFAGDQETLDVMFQRFEKLFEVLYGHMNEIVLAFREQTDLDIGPISRSVCWRKASMISFMWP